MTRATRDLSQFLLFDFVFLKKRTITLWKANWNVKILKYILQCWKIYRCVKNYKNECCWCWEKSFIDRLFNQFFSWYFAQTKQKKFSILAFIVHFLTHEFKCICWTWLTFFNKNVTCFVHIDYKNEKSFFDYQTNDFSWSICLFKSFTNSKLNFSFNEFNIILIHR